MINDLCFSIMSVALIGVLVIAFIAAVVTFIQEIIYRINEHIDHIAWKRTYQWLKEDGFFDR